ncbi:MAG: hypothetical protein H8E61_07215, partial [Bacteroidetes bacterium]|nr:hypothetical protein [Bacteroidota bacterium]
SSQVGYFKIQVPQGTIQKVAKVAPYLLEDSLLDSPKDYIYLPLTKENNLLEIYVVSKQLIQSLQDDLTAAKIKNYRVIPEFLILDYEPNNWQLKLTDSHGFLRMSAYNGMVIDNKLSNEMPQMLKLALTSAKYDNNYPHALTILISEEAHEAAINQWEISYDCHINIKKDTLNYTGWLASLDDQPANNINLMKDFRGLEQHHKTLKKFIPAIITLCFSILLLTTGIVIEHQIIKKEYDQTWNSMVDIYQETFPEAQNISDPVYQMKNKIAKMNKPQKKVKFTDLLIKIANELKGNVEIYKLDYQNKTITFDVKTKDYKILESIKANLKNKGLAIKIKGGKRDKNKINARIQLTI